MWSTNILGNTEDLEHMLLHFKSDSDTHFKMETYPLTSKTQWNSAVLKGIKIMCCDCG